MQRMSLALALVATATAGAGVSYAQTMPPSRAMPPSQTMPSSQTMPAGQTMQTSEPRDPYGHSFIGRNDWVRQPGDRPGPSGNPNVATAPAARAAPGAMTRQQQSGPRQTAFKDEYGFRYDSEGNRLNAQGYIISPQTR